MLFGHSMFELTTLGVMAFLPFVRSLFGTSSGLLDRISEVVHFRALVDRIVHCLFDGSSLANDTKQI